MMRIVYFSQKDQFFKRIENISGEKIFITPGPSMADSLRELISNRLLITAVDVVTISKFMSELLEKLWSEKERPNYKKKSEIILILGILKKTYLPDLSFEQFKEAYNVFSDLRSFTLNIDVASTALRHQPEIIQKSVFVFWKLMEVTAFVDDHATINLISEKLRNDHFTEPESDKLNYIFWGFYHLNGIQLDFLKTLALIYDVYVPFPIDLKEVIRKTDWISWLEDFSSTEELISSEKKVPRVQMAPINSREIASSLKNILSSDDQIILGVRELLPAHIDLIPSTDVSFKVSIDFLKNEILEIEEEVKSFKGTSADLQHFLESKMNQSTSFRHRKVWQLYQEAVNDALALTDEVLTVDHFFLKLIFEVIRLNRPRTSFIPLSQEKKTIDLKDISKIQDIDPGRRVILCIDERFGEVMTTAERYSLAVQKDLASIGPLKRNQLEIEMRSWELKYLFSESEVIVLMNKELLKHDLTWNKIFEGVIFDNFLFKKNNPQKDLEDHLKKEFNEQIHVSFSATKLQTYLDCPRKFFFTYIQPVFPRYMEKQDLGAVFIGTIVHEVIERFFRERLIHQDLSGLVREIVQTYILKEQLTLTQTTLFQKELLINIRAKNGIEFIQKFESLADEKIQWSFEKAFQISSPGHLSGRIDCLGIGERNIYLLDFKSTEYSRPAASEVFEFKAIQLWIYVLGIQHNLVEFDKKNVVLGYVVLDEVSKSTLFTSNDDFFLKFKTFDLFKVHKFKQNFITELHEVQIKFNHLIDQIKKDRYFPPSPRNKSICEFCELEKICPKGELIHG